VSLNPDSAFTGIPNFPSILTTFISPFRIIRIRTFDRYLYASLGQPFAQVGKQYTTAKVRSDDVDYNQKLRGFRG